VSRPISACLAAAALVVGSCGADRHDPVGVTPMTSTNDHPSPSASSSAAPTWPHLPALKTYARANTQRFVSGGHFFGRYAADILVNDVGAKAYGAIAPGKTLPVGAVVAMVHAAKAGEGMGPIFAMEKRDDGWTYVETDEAGHVLRSGKLHPCVDCHAHVVSQDELFGVPTTGR
jgi:hypothetical protein